jgi:hypothetical protein
LKHPCLYFSRRGHFAFDRNYKFLLRQKGLNSSKILTYITCITSQGAMHCTVMLWHAREPNWLALSWPLTSMCLWSPVRITFSKHLPIVDKRLIGREFWGNTGSLTGFSKVMIFASFQDFGKCANQRQWLNKCVKCTSGLLGRCLRHLFGIPSIPQAFLSFNNCIHLYISQGVVVYSFKQCLDSSLHPPFMVFNAQVTWCKLEHTAQKTLFPTVPLLLCSYPLPRLVFI